MTSAIAMPGCRLPDSGYEGGLNASLPALPALSALLHGARRLQDTEDWRSGMQAALGMSGIGATPARVAASATGLAVGMSICLVQPVHVVAGISRVFLGDAGSSHLSSSDRETLRTAFNAEFGSTDVCLHAVGNGWLLQAPFAAAADEADPALRVGEALAREPARLEAARSLRRLGAEVEMWLAGLPLNVDRQLCGAPPINAFWFWGGATVGELPRPLPLPRVICGLGEPGPWLLGLAAHCAVPLRQASGWREVRDANQGVDALIVLQPAGLAGATPHLAEWEDAWFEPVLRDLQAGRLPALRMQIGCRAWQWPAPRISRWLRRRQPWWQMVSA
jgi:hypothetical protein